MKAAKKSPPNPKDGSFHLWPLFISFKTPRLTSIDSSSSQIYLFRSELFSTPTDHSADKIKSKVITNLLIKTFVSTGSSKRHVDTANKLIEVVIVLGSPKTSWSQRKYTRDIFPVGESRWNGNAKEICTLKMFWILHCFTLPLTLRCSGNNVFCLARQGSSLRIKWKTHTILRHM